MSVDDTLTLSQHERIQLWFLGFGVLPQDFQWLHLPNPLKDFWRHHQGHKSVPQVNPSYYTSWHLPDLFRWSGINEL